MMTSVTSVAAAAASTITITRNVVSFAKTSDPRMVCSDNNFVNHNSDTTSSIWSMIRTQLTLVR